MFGQNLIGTGVSTGSPCPISDVVGGRVEKLARIRNKGNRPISKVEVHENSFLSTKCSWKPSDMGLIKETMEDSLSSLCFSRFFFGRELWHK